SVDSCAKNTGTGAQRAIPDVHVHYQFCTSSGGKAPRRNERDGDFALVIVLRVAVKRIAMVFVQQPRRFYEIPSVIACSEGSSHQNRGLATVGHYPVLLWRHRPRACPQGRPRRPAED